MNNPKKVAKFNWETLNIYGQIEKQLPNLCWLYTVVEYLEALYQKVHGVPVKLSKQELLDKCEDKKSTGSRYELKVTDALLWVLRNGICFEDGYPEFCGIKQKPVSRSANARVVDISGLVIQNGDDEDRILEALANQPVIARLDIDAKRYDNLAPNSPYGLPKDSYEHSCNHAIQLVGWRSRTYHNSYYVRDPNSDDAPGDGRYLVKRPSSIDFNVEINPIIHVLYVCNIWERKRGN